MSNPYINAPYIRPDVPREQQGTIGAMGQGLSGLAQFLTAMKAHQDQIALLKGHLAFQQEQFDAQQTAAKNHQKQLDTLGAQLTHAYGQANDPAAFAQAVQESIGPAVSAGMEPGPLIADAGAARQRAQQDVISQTVQRITGSTNWNDPTAAVRGLANIAALSPQAADAIGQGLNRLGGKQQIVVAKDGSILSVDPQGGAVRTLMGPNGPGGAGGATTAKMQQQAKIALPLLLNLRTLVQNDQTAMHMPMGASSLQTGGTGGQGGSRGILQEGIQRLVTSGATGATQNQLLFQNYANQFLPAYAALFGRASGGGGGVGMLPVLRSGLFGNAGETDPQTLRTLVKSWDPIIGALTSLASGKQVDITTLPYASQLISAQAAPQPGSAGNLMQFLNPPSGGAGGAQGASVTPQAAPVSQ